MPHRYTRQLFPWSVGNRKELRDRQIGRALEDEVDRDDVAPLNRAAAVRSEGAKRKVHCEWGRLRVFAGWRQVEAASARNIAIAALLNYDVEVEATGQPAKIDPEPLVTGKVEVHRANALTIDQLDTGVRPIAERWCRRSAGPVRCERLW
jgi:hypothetical protein